nr:hypothetical protein CFP56_00311 [Quercus suber]
MPTCAPSSSSSSPSSSTLVHCRDRDRPLRLYLTHWQDRDVVDGESLWCTHLTTPLEHRTKILRSWNTSTEHSHRCDIMKHSFIVLAKNPIPVEEAKDGRHLRVAMHVRTWSWFHPCIAACQVLRLTFQAQPSVNQENWHTRPDTCHNLGSLALPSAVQSYQSLTHMCALAWMYTAAATDIRRGMARLCGYVMRARTPTTFRPPTRASHPTRHSYYILLQYQPSLQLLRPDPSHDRFPTHSRWTGTGRTRSDPARTTVTTPAVSGGMVILRAPQSLKLELLHP